MMVKGQEQAAGGDVKKRSRKQHKGEEEGERGLVKQERQQEKKPSQPDQREKDKAKKRKRDETEDANENGASDKEIDESEAKSPRSKSKSTSRPSKPRKEDDTKEKSDRKPAKFLRLDERRDLVAQAKEIWEKVKPQQQSQDDDTTNKQASTPQKREQLKKDITKLYDLIRTRMREIVFRHDGSRIIQWLLTHSKDSRIEKGVMVELVDNDDKELFVRLLNDRYGKYLALKVFKSCKNSRKVELFHRFIYKNMGAFLKQAQSMNTLDLLYTTMFNATCKNQLVVSMLFSKHNNMYFDQISSDNGNTMKFEQFILEENNIIQDEFKNSIMDNCYELIQSFMEKDRLLSLELVHVVMKEWMNVAFKLSTKTNIEKLKAIAVNLASNLIHFTHTKAGLWICVLCIKILDAKHRKKVVRSLKGHIRKLVVDEYGIKVLLTLQEFMDDTRLLGKVLSTELCTTEKVEPDVHLNNTTETENDKNDDNEQIKEELSKIGHSKSRGGLSRAEKKKAKQKEEGDKMDATKKGDEEKNIVEIKEENGIDLEWMEEMCCNKYSRMVLLHVLFGGRENRYFNPETYAPIWSKLDGDLYGQTSKKDEDVRLKELRQWYAKGFCKLIERRGPKLLVNPNGGPVVVGGIKHDEDGMKQSVHKCVCAVMKSTDGLKKICGNEVGKRVLTAMLKVGQEDGQEFSKSVIEQVGGKVKIVQRIKHNSNSNCDNLIRCIESIN